jgi:hypothetical protein
MATLATTRPLTAVAAANFSGGAASTTGNGNGGLSTDGATGACEPL